MKNYKSKVKVNTNVSNYFSQKKYRKNDETMYRNEKAFYIGSNPNNMIPDRSRNPSVSSIR